MKNAHNGPVKWRFPWEKVLTVAVIAGIVIAFIYYRSYRYRYLNNKITEAVKNNDLDEFKRLYALGGKLEGNDDDNKRTLWIAVENKNYDICKFILEHDDWNGAFDQEIIQMAIENQDLGMVKWVLEYLCHPDRRRYVSRPELFKVLVDTRMANNISLETQLSLAKLGLGYELNVYPSTYEYAAQHRQNELVLFLAEQSGEEIEPRWPQDHCTALDYAFLNGDNEFAQALLALGCKKTIRSAILLDDLALMDSMNSSDISFEPGLVQFAIEHASTDGLFKVMTMYAKHADTKSVVDDYLKELIARDETRLFEKLEGFGVQFESIKLDGKSIIEYAIYKKLPNLFDYALEQHPDPSAKDNSGCTPLFNAILYQDKKAFDRLLDMGVDVNVLSSPDLWIPKDGIKISIRGENFSNIEIACHLERPDFVKKLISAGALIDNPPATHPLAAAVNHGRISRCAEILLAHGAKITDNHLADIQLRASVSNFRGMELVKFWLEQGGDPNYVPNKVWYSKGKMSTIEMALHFGEMDAYKFLKEFDNKK